MLSENSPEPRQPVPKFETTVPLPAIKLVATTKRGNNGVAAMAGGPSPDPVDSSRLAEALLAIERRVAALEEETRARNVGVKRPRLVMVSLLIALLIAVIGLLWQPFAPRNYAQCAEAAAREAKTNPALHIRLRSCGDRFGSR